MSLIDTFAAYDEQNNEYIVNVNCTEHHVINGLTRNICDYSLKSTGELLRQQKDNKRKFLIRSTNTMIVDFRDLP